MSQPPLLPACLAIFIASAFPAKAADAPAAPMGPLGGPLVFTLDNGDYVALDNAEGEPIRGISQPRGIPGAPSWEDDGLEVITWRSDIARVQMPPEGATATVTNRFGHCLTLYAVEDIRWATCRGGDTTQVWQVHDGSLQSSPPWQGYLAYEKGFLDGRLHIVRGEHTMSLVPGVLTPAD